MATDSDPPSPPERQYDVFISYAHADQAWVAVLAENLHHAGLEVFFDQWKTCWMPRAW